MTNGTLSSTLLSVLVGSGASLSLLIWRWRLCIRIAKLVWKFPANYLAVYRLNVLLRRHAEYSLLFELRANKKGASAIFMVGEKRAVWRSSNPVQQQAAAALVLAHNSYILQSIARWLTLILEEDTSRSLIDARFLSNSLTRLAAFPHVQLTVYEQHTGTGRPQLCTYAGTGKDMVVKILSLTHSANLYGKQYQVFARINHEPFQE